MRRKAAAIVQQREGWYGLTFTVKDRSIGDLDLYSGRSLDELRSVVGRNTYGLALENGSAYLFNLVFPFSDRRKIRLVIGSELEQRLPFSVDDMEVGFVETGRGRVLAATLPKAVANELRRDSQMRITTVQSLATLYALRWFRLVPDEDFVFVHMNEKAIVVMAFKGSDLYLLRQFFHSPETDSLGEVFAEMARDREFIPTSYVMIGDNGEAEVARERLESRFDVRIQTPSLRYTLDAADIPEWYWPGIGAALMSIRPKGQLNLTSKKGGYSLFSSKTGVSVCAGLASLGLLASGLSYFDYSMKQRAYAYLAGEPGRIYRTAFPKSPPPRDPIVMFKEKIKALDKEPGSVTATASPLALLNELSSKVSPELDVKVSEFSSDDKEFSITGTTVSFAALEKIKVRRSRRFRPEAMSLGSAGAASAAGSRST